MTAAATDRRRANAAHQRARYWRAKRGLRPISVDVDPAVLETFLIDVGWMLRGDAGDAGALRTAASRLLGSLATAHLAKRSETREARAASANEASLRTRSDGGMICEGDRGEALAEPRGDGDARDEAKRVGRASCAAGRDAGAAGAGVSDGAAARRRIRPAKSPTPSPLASMKLPTERQ